MFWYSLSFIFFPSGFFSKKEMLIMPYFGQLYLYVCPSPKKHFSYIICRRPNLQKWPRIMSAMLALPADPSKI